MTMPLPLFQHVSKLGDNVSKKGLVYNYNNYNNKINFLSLSEPPAVKIALCKRPPLAPCRFDSG